MARRWSRPRSVAAALGVAVLALSPVMAGAAPLTTATIYEPVGFFRFCAEAQLEAANILDGPAADAGIKVSGTIWDDYTPGDFEADFVLSKSSVDIANKRIMTSQAVLYRDAERTQPETILCKFRTAESLNAGPWPGGALNNSPGFEVDPYYGFGSAADGLVESDVDEKCSVLNQTTINTVWDSLDGGQQAVAPYSPENETLVTTLDVPTYSGPEWLEPQAPLTLNGNVLQVGSRSLNAPTTQDGAPRTLGANYCTLVAPTYLRDVLLGDAGVA
jgi:hypothetical protein